MTAGRSADVRLRLATPTDVPRLERLIVASARRLGHGFYTEAETEAAIAHVFGVDTGLVADGTYLVAEEGSAARDGTAAILGCGGWSRRRTLFGGDRFAGRDDAPLDPAIDAARIRAFFVAPEAARRRVATRLLAACEDAARSAGFRTMALMATLPGEPFYSRHGYVAASTVWHDCGGVPVRFVPMGKPLAVA